MKVKGERTRGKDRRKSSGTYFKERKRKRERERERG